MPDVARLRAVVTADTKQATGALRQFSGEVDRTAQGSGKLNAANQAAAKSAASFATQLQKSAKAATMVGAAVTAGVLVPTGLVAKTAIQAGISFESAFAGVRKTVDATEQEFAVLRDGIRQMAREIPASANEIANVAEAAGQLGVATEDILGFTRVMIDMGVATTMSSEEAAMSIARFMNVMGTMPDEVSNIGSAIVGLGNNFATTESEIMAMAQRIAGAGKVIGLAESDVLALATSLSSVGIEAQAGGTAISRVMIEMANAVANGTDKLDQMAVVAGLSVEEFSRLFREDAIEAVFAFISGLNEAEAAGQNVFGIMEELGLNEIRVRNALLLSASARDLLNDAIRQSAEFYREDIALAEEAAQRYETTASKIQILKNNLTDAGITIFDRLEPAISRVIDDLTNFAQSRAFDAILDDFASDLEDVGYQLSHFIQNDLPDFAAKLGDVASAGVGVVSFMGDLVSKANEVDQALGGDGWKILLAAYAGGKIGGPAGAITGTAVAAANERSEGREGSAFWRIGSEIIGLPGSQHWEDTLFDDFFQLLEDAADQVIPDYMSALVAAEGEQHKFSESALAAVDAVEQGQQAYRDAAAELERADFAAAAVDVHENAVAMQEAALNAQSYTAAVQELAHGLDIAHIINASWNNSVATAAQNVSHWEGMTSSAQSALDILNQRIADGIPLSEEQQEQYNLLTQGVERYKGGVEDQQDAFIKAEADRVKYTQGLDELNQQLKDGAINQDTYNQRVAELAEGIDPAITSQANLQAATEQLYGKMEDLVDVIYRIMEALGLLEDEDPTVTVDSDISDFELKYKEVSGKEFAEKVAKIRADNADWDAGASEVESKEFAAKVAEIHANSQPAWDEFRNLDLKSFDPKNVEVNATGNAQPTLTGIEGQLAALDGRSATVYVNVQTADTANAEFMMGGIPQYASGGRVPHDQLALVGEEGPELVMLPGGAEVLSAAKTRGMLSPTGLDFTLTANLDIQPALDNLYELARYVPHSPAETGPFSKMPDWDWVFSGISDSVKEQTKEAEDSMAAFDEAMRDYNVWDFVLGDLESIVSGDAGRTLRDNLDLLNQQLRIAIEMGAPQAVIDGLNAAIAQTEQRLEDIGRVLATPIASGMAAQLRAGDIWESAFRNLEDVVTGERIVELREQANELARQLRIAVELNLPDEFIAGIEAAIAETQAEINSSMAIAGTEAGQAWADALAEAAHAEARFDWWMNAIPSLDQVIREGNLDRWEQLVEDARRRLEFAREAGAPPDVIKQLEQDLAAAENNLAVAGTMLAKALREGWVDQIEPMTQETLDQILDMMDELDKTLPGRGLDIAESLLDDVVAGVFSGRVELEQALELIPRQLLDSLDEMKQALEIELAEALLTGAENAGLLEEHLKILIDLMDAVRGSAESAAVAVGTFVPGRGYYYSQGIYTTGGQGSNLSTMGENFTTFADHKASRLEAHLYLDKREVGHGVSETFTNKHKISATMGSTGRAF